MDLLGDQWTMLVLREAFLGETRFERFQSSLGIARNTLTERLDRLTGAGLLRRSRYQLKPARYEYLLTEMGRDVLPVLVAIMRWGDRWLGGPQGENPWPPAIVRHTDCGRQTNADINCTHCGGPLTADRTELHWHKRR